MNTNSNSYVMGFAVVMCVSVSTVLALLANGLKETQDAAKEFDRQKNVMMAAGLIERGDPRAREELEQLFKDRITEDIVDTRTGDKVEGKTAKDLKDLNAEAMKADSKVKNPFRSVATSRTDGKLEAIVLPISGKGLWSILKGYLALGADKNTVKGITFYEHGETPGLGGEVENAGWQAQWVGKQIRDASGKLVSVTVKKGKVDNSIAAQKAHMVDGLAGATITCNGVNAFVQRDLATFQTYLEKN